MEALQALACSAPLSTKSVGQFLLCLGSVNCEQIMLSKKKISFAQKYIREKKALNDYFSKFPNEYYDGSGYWHCHLPINYDLLDNGKSTKYFRKALAQVIIDKTKCLLQIKPIIDRKIRVISLVKLPNIYNSQIIIFYDTKYYETFFSRNSEEQIWTKLPLFRSLSSEYQLELPIDFKEVGYREVIKDEDCYKISELWFFGEVE